LPRIASIAYSLPTHEQVLRGFFEGIVPATELASDVASSLRQTGPTSDEVAIVDMQDEFVVRPEHAVRLCVAVLNRELPAEGLCVIGFALMASDKFYWDGDENEVLANVIADWSCPEVNYPLNEESVKRFRAWLLHEESYPEKPSSTSGADKLVSLRRKRTLSD
jgi:hypothetical protein